MLNAAASGRALDGIRTCRATLQRDERVPPPHRTQDHL